MTYDADRNSLESWRLAQRAKREVMVRRGEVVPVSDDERRQADDGPRPWRELDCVKWGEDDVSRRDTDGGGAGAGDDAMSAWERKVSAFQRQVGGSHYKEMPIQPLEFFYRNKIGGCEAVAIRYILRWHKKGGIEDLDKAIHTLEFLRELVASDAPSADTAYRSASPSEDGESGREDCGA